MTWFFAASSMCVWFFIHIYISHTANRRSPYGPDETTSLSFPGWLESHTSHESIWQKKKKKRHLWRVHRLSWSLNGVLSVCVCLVDPLLTLAYPLPPPPRLQETSQREGKRGGGSGWLRIHQPGSESCVWACARSDSRRGQARSSPDFLFIFPDVFKFSSSLY